MKNRITPSFSQFKRSNLTDSIRIRPTYSQECSKNYRYKENSGKFCKASE
ncbi:hypothetical protein SynROS8604_01057 [Synechococcus sp. ROS8604]|nr:hypothetical protein SynROS8604_01057 [Synechococcus sp. ROS8604]